MWLLIRCICIVVIDICLILMCVRLLLLFCLCCYYFGWLGVWIALFWCWFVFSWNCWCFCCCLRVFADSALRGLFVWCCWCCCLFWLTVFLLGLRFDSCDDVVFTRWKWFNSVAMICHSVYMFFVIWFGFNDLLFGLGCDWLSLVIWLCIAWCWLVSFIFG